MLIERISGADEGARGAHATVAPSRGATPRALSRVTRHVLKIAVNISLTRTSSNTRI